MIALKMKKSYKGLVVLLPRILGLVLLLCFPTISGQGTSPAEAQEQSTYVYVAPNVVQVRSANDIFTTFALTNTTEYWFNPRIYLVDLEGDVVRHFAPLLKGFGTWQKSSVSLMPEDFHGSVWILSSQPIVGTAMIHQSSNGSLTLLGSTELKLMEPKAAESLRQRLERLSP